MKLMHSPAGQGANRSDTGQYREDLQRRHAGEGAISYAGYLRYSTPRPSGTCGQPSRVAMSLYTAMAITD
ncbi:MAG TPA: hypothetical protein PK606_07325, partial [Ottowia sp.]|uniref:hypothetical protein n=1 Tax=Ottowia sp. TaxID=1898956 RepID=UPI002CA14823